VESEFVLHHLLGGQIGVERVGTRRAPNVDATEGASLGSIQVVVGSVNNVRKCRSGEGQTIKRDVMCFLFVSLHLLEQPCAEHEREIGS
jgi:hypothetical protein